MNILVAQFILAGPGDDAEGWMNILFVVVLAVFWIIGGIIKATSNKPQDKQKQKASGKPVRQVPHPSTVRDPSSARPMRKTPLHSQTLPRPATNAAEFEKARRSRTVEAAQKLESIPAKPAAETILQDLPEFTRKPLVELGPMRPDLPKRTPEAEGDLPELVLDYTDPDELSKAILHYEILGPPVSLRNPSNQTIGV